jgi:translation elongation factor EF-Ts
MPAHFVTSYIHHNNQMGSIVHLTCETDFVARTSEFHELADLIAKQIAATGALSFDEILHSPLVTNESITVAQLIQDAEKTFGEDINLVDFYYAA